MSYLQQIIQPDEKVRHIGKLHWIIYARGCTVILLFAISYLTFSLASGEETSLGSLVVVFGIFVGVILLIDATVRQ